jgi:hypothetical protein
VATLKLPVLTLREKRQALEKAQKMRSERKEIREQLKSGSMSLGEVLAKEDNEIMGKMRVAYLLASLPRVGKTTAKKVMEEIGIDESRRVQGLGTRQKEALLARFPRR